jgi:hypothetical protein
MSVTPYIISFILRALAIAYCLKGAIIEQDMFLGTLAICFTFWTGWSMANLIRDIELYEAIMRSEMEGNKHDNGK